MSATIPVGSIRDEGIRRPTGAHARGLCFLLAALLSAPATAGTAAALEGRVDGVILDGTLGGPGVAELVRILSLKGGMSEVASLEDVSGRFQFLAIEGDPGDPFLVQANRAGVNYSRPFTFDSSGVNTVELVAYDTTSSWDDVRVLRYQLGLAAETKVLRVFKVFEVANEGRPPKSVVGNPGAFLFATQPDLIEIHTVSAQSGSLPLTLSSIAVDGGKQAVPYALRPGTTEFQIAYDVGYDPAGTSFSEPLLYQVEEMNALVVPERLSVTSELLSDRGVDSEKKLLVFSGRDLPAGTPIVLRLSGEGSPTTSAATRDAGPGAGAGAMPRSDGGPATEAGSEEKVVRVPNRTSRTAPAVIAGVIAALVGTLLFALSRRPATRAGGRHAADPAVLGMREVILDRIVALDRKHRAGEISDYAYWLKRETLKSELTEILEQTGRGAGAPG